MPFAYTNHLGQRLRERKLERGDVDWTISHPDSVSNSRGARQYKRRIGYQTITAVVKTTDDGTDLVISAWIDPPNPGTRDARKKELYTAYQKAHGLRKWWLAFHLALFGA